MTIAEILEQVKTLSQAELDELITQIQAIQSAPEHPHKPKTGAEIVALLQAMDSPIELADPAIEDPVEWVKAQRHKRKEKLNAQWDDKP